MNLSIREKTERVFKQELETILGAGWKVYTSRGPDPDPNKAIQARQTPPFVLLETEGAEELDEDMWIVPLLVGYVTAAVETIPTDHTAKVQQLYEAIRSVISPARDATIGYTLHGFSISTGDAFTDETRHARGDVFRVDVACSGFQPP